MEKVLDWIIIIAVCIVTILSGFCGEKCILVIRDFGLISLPGIICGLVLASLICYVLALFIVSVITLYGIIRNKVSKEYTEDCEDIEQETEIVTTESPMALNYKAYIPQYELNIDLENTAILVKVPSSTKVIVVEED